VRWASKVTKSALDESWSQGNRKRRCMKTNPKILIMNKHNRRKRRSFFDETKIKNLFPSEVDLEIPFQPLALLTATSQISSLVFCLVWSVKFNFRESTATHCRVDNYLPSLSATLDFTPQRDVWRACIGLSGMPRYLIAYLYHKMIFNSQVLLFLHWTEITALIGLSIVDSLRYFSKFN